MEKILISACLIGERVRYDGRALTVSDKLLQVWVREGRHVPICPEVAAGLPIPRAAAEITGGDGHGVLNGDATVVDNTGSDVTRYFTLGAQAALALCRQHNIRVAVLAESSPSCGSSTIYDGGFGGKKISGMGVTAALLRKHGVRVFSQFDLSSADAALKRIGR